MISTEQALQTVLNSAQDFGVEEIPFIKSVGRILKEDIKADRDFPPFNRVSMDGIAIDYSSFKNGQRNFVLKEFKLQEANKSHYKIQKIVLK